MIFKDEKGTKFTWKVHCIPIVVDNEKVDCIHCHGTGRLSDPYIMYDDKNCEYCFGSGKMNKAVSCYDTDLEKYLQSKIEEYYKEQTNNFIGENI